MPRLTKIYTRKGDDGTTALGTRKRVRKDDLRVECYGTLDELNSWLGWALSQGLAPRLAETLPPIQNQLLHLGAQLAFPPENGQQTAGPRIQAKHVKALESLIDEFNAEVGLLENFILPGGAPGAAALQIARAVCRRAERRMASLAAEQPVATENMAYVNRLSDLLFVMGRYENQHRDVSEPLWDSRA